MIFPLVALTTAITVKEHYSLNGTDKSIDELAKIPPPSVCVSMVIYACVTLSCNA